MIQVKAAQRLGSCDPEDFTVYLISDAVRHGASPEAVRLGLIVFGFGPCPNCDYVKRGCRCKEFGRWADDGGPCASSKEKP